MATIYSRVRRRDPFTGPEGKRTATKKSTGPLDDIVTMMLAGTALLERRETILLPPSSNKEQEYWDKTRLSIVLVELMPGIEYIASQGLPLPYLEMIEQHTVQNIVVRLVSILDDRLQSFLSAKRMRSLSSLDERIKIADKKGFVSNAPDLHKLRRLRNDISHEPMPQPIRWDDVHDAADHVERALCDLSLISNAPKFTVENISLTKFEKSDKEHELGRRQLEIDVMADGQLHSQYVWPYVYFVDPVWSPT